VGQTHRAKDRWRFIELERSVTASAEAMEAEAAVAARFPADVFVVLLKPRVNYARGINERLEQRAIGSKSGQLGSEQSK